MTARGIDALLREVVFAVDGTPYLGGDVVLAAKRWGAWTSLEEQARQGIACLRRLVDRGEALAAGDLESVAQEFRYDRNLISGQEMEAWLERWALTLDEWTDYLRRSVLRGAWADQLPHVVAAYPPCRTEIDRCLHAEAICSGRFEGWARELAGRASAWARAREEGWLPEDVESGDRAQTLERIDAGFQRFRDEILRPEAVREQIATHQLDWIRVDYRCAEFPTRQSAGEAALCVREDGMTLDEVAARAHVSAEDTRGCLEDLEADLRTHLVGARPGELIGPLGRGDRFVLVLVRDKALPSSEDPETCRRAEARFLQSAVDRESSGRVRWSAGITT